MRAKIIKTDKWIDVEKFKAAYRDKKTLYTYAPEELEFQEIDWDAFRREAAKDFMTAIIAREAPQYDFACRNVSVRVSEAIMWADELIKQLKGI